MRGEHAENVGLNPRERHGGPVRSVPPAAGLLGRPPHARRALPPAFPAARIDGDLYWDGGILSNTPVEAVFDDYPRRNALVFVVHLWNPHGSEPETIWQVLNRQKDIQYASRAVTHTVKQSSYTGFGMLYPNW